MIIALSCNTDFITLHLVRGLLIHKCNVFLLTPANDQKISEPKCEGIENRANTVTTNLLAP